jgi:hypothetical protein
MIGFVLLRGKEFSIPDGVSTAIIGLFFGLVCGLFYYQHYYKPWFWVISLAGGLILTDISNWVFMHNGLADDDSAIRLTIASFAIPFVLTLALNHGLYLIKIKKRKTRSRRKLHSHFFDTVNPAEALEPAAHVRHKSTST